MQPRGMVLVNAADTGSGMDQVEFYAFYAGIWNWIGTDSDGSDGWGLVWPTMEITEETIDLRVVAADVAGNESVEELSLLQLRGSHTFGNGYQTRVGDESGSAAAADPPTEILAPTVSPKEQKKLSPHYQCFMKYLMQ